ncbi:MAG: cupin domain-containing protein [Candidatus Micrarchaeota archaeon]
MAEAFSKDLEGVMQFPKEGIFSTVFSKTEKQNCTLMCLSAGTDIEEHTSTKDGIVLVLKGRGVFRLVNEDVKMKPGVFISMPANTPHSLKAEEDLAILLILTE